MALFKFEFVFAIIVSLWVFKSTWSCGLTVKYPPVFFFFFFLWFDRVRGLTATVAWPSCYGLTVYEKIIVPSSFFRKRSSHNKTVELVFTTIMDIRKNMLIRFGLEISWAIFYCSLAVCVAWMSCCDLTVYGKEILRRGHSIFQFLLSNKQTYEKNFIQ